MAKTEHLYRRGGIYYWRRRLPLNLSSKIGREDVARSLLTADPKDARRRSRRLSTVTDEFFQVAQSDSSLTPETITRILQDLLRVEIDEAERAIVSARSQSRDESDDYIEILRDHREEHQRDLSENHLQGVHRWADEALAERGLTADKSSQEYRELCRGILRVRIDATTEEINRREGNYPSLLQLPQPPNGTPSPPPPVGGPPLSEASQRYSAEMTKGGHGWTAQTKNQNEMTLRLLKDFLEDKPACAVVREDIVRFKEDVLDRLPQKHGKSPKDRDKSLAEVLAEAASSGATTLSAKTVKRHLSALSGYFEWAKGVNLHSGDNPARGFRFPKSKRARDQRLAWSNDELKKLFASPIWAGCHPVFRTQVGPEVIRDAYYWLPLIGLYSGMRLEEIAQLYLADVREEDSVWFFDVHAGEGRQVKSQAGVRRVPIHSELVRLGLLTRRHRLLDGKEQRLFPELKAGGADGKFGAYYTKRFSTYIRDLKIARPGVTFHSLRKNTATALKNAGIPEGHTADILGHEGRTQSYGRYAEPVELRNLQAAVERIRPITSWLSKE